MTGESFYDQVGGHETFVKLVHEFYRGVAGDPPLRALYPEDDLGPAEVRFRMFLEQYWGGPTTYSDMMAAVDTLDLAPANDLLLRDYLERAAHSMVNSLQA